MCVLLPCALPGWKESVTCKVSAGMQCRSMCGLSSADNGVVLCKEKVLPRAFKPHRKQETPFEWQASSSPPFEQAGEAHWDLSRGRKLGPYLSCRWAA